MKAVMDEKVMKGQVHCPICTHSVDADVDMSTKKPRVVPGQRCQRCSATLDAGFVLEVQEAA
jgi:transposase-like protein